MLPPTHSHPSARRSYLGNNIFLILILFFTSSFLYSSEILDAIKNGTPNLELRLSFEHSDLSDNGLNSANALNLRTRVGYQTGEYGIAHAFVQLQDVSALVDEYSPEDLKYDTVADPEGTSVYQAYLGMNLYEDTLIKVGRQEITRDDHRLMGHVGWRQQGQTFEAVTVQNQTLENTVLYLGAVSKVKTIFDTTLDLEHLILFDVENKDIKNLSIRTYAYFLDTEGGLNSDQDKATFGARLKGQLAPLDYFVDYAFQKDYQDSNLDGGEMINAYLSSKVKEVQLGIGFNSISGAEGNDRPFDTLYSTAHKFNGWSDQFLSTNGGNLIDGLEDLYIDVRGKIAEVSLLARAHQFQRETNHDDYGNEYDFLIERKLSDNLTGLIKLAFYEADNNNLTGPASKDETLVIARLMYKI